MVKEKSKCKYGWKPTLPCGHLSVGDRVSNCMRIRRGPDTEDNRSNYIL
jgi:hypothetical protein